MLISIGPLKKKCRKFYLSKLFYSTLVQFLFLLFYDLILDYLVQVNIGIKVQVREPCHDHFIINLPNGDILQRKLHKKPYGLVQSITFYCSLEAQKSLLESVAIYFLRMKSPTCTASSLLVKEPLSWFCDNSFLKRVTRKKQLHSSCWRRIN